jgi:ankyrin
LGVGGSIVNLLAACKQKKTLEALQLLAAGANPNIASKAGETPLHWAVINSDAKLVRALLEAGANPNVSTQSKKAVGRGAGKATPLHFAASRANIEIVDRLLEAGADPRVIDATGFSVLHAAVYSPELAVLRKLVEAGADPNDGSLALAVRDGSLDAVCELLSVGASPHGNGGDFPPLRMAYACNKTEVAKVLIAAGARWPDDAGQK